MLQCLAISSCGLRCSRPEKWTATAICLVRILSQVPEILVAHQERLVSPHTRLSLLALEATL